jgi:transcription antitermination factor NusG
MFGYVFVAAEGDLPWQSINDIPGVRGFIAQEDEPYALRPSDVERLLALSEVVAPDDDPDRSLRPGDMARIINGPYSGKIVRVVDIVGGNAKWVGELLGSKRTISTRLSNLEAA